MKVPYTPLILYTSLLVIYLSSSLYMLGLQRRLRQSDKQEVTAAGKYELCFLTTWNFIGQILFMILAILEEAGSFIAVLANFRSFFAKARTIVFHSAVFPGTLTVSTLFWTLWNIDPDQIVPKNVREMFPFWLNHVLHTSIALTVIIELMLPKRDNFIQYKTAFWCISLFGTAYAFVYYCLYYYTGYWLYPFFTGISWTSRIILSILLFVIGISLTNLSVYLQNLKRPALKYE